ncbi:hypothetical protein J6590_035650 [Homalodisca vitripennis]|nr:hypothetical protein J6590_035650 [Homalodisca vitripennis]
MTNNLESALQNNSRNLSVQIALRPKNGKTLRPHLKQAVCERNVLSTPIPNVGPHATADVRSRSCCELLFTTMCGDIGWKDVKIFGVISTTEEAVPDQHVSEGHLVSAGEPPTGSWETAR